LWSWLCLVNGILMKCRDTGMYRWMFQGREFRECVVGAVNYTALVLDTLWTLCIHCPFNGHNSSVSPTTRTFIMTISQKGNRSKEGLSNSSPTPQHCPMLQRVIGRALFKSRPSDVGNNSQPWVHIASLGKLEPAHTGEPPLLPLGRPGVWGAQLLHEPVTCNLC
jgi:hypothetical protein